MALKDKELAPLFLPGTIALPSPFPSVGKIEMDEDGAAFRRVDEPGALLIVRHRIEPSTDVCWTILVERVSAILLTGCNRLDQDKAVWLFGPSVAKLNSITEGGVAQGIVFVPEDAPLLMHLAFGTTASESTTYAIPGWGPPCDGCDERAFAYERIMAGPDQG